MKKYFKLHKGKLAQYILCSMLYSIILASTGFVLSALTNAALSSHFDKFIKAAVFSVIFLLVDSVFDFVPRYLRAKVTNSILVSIRSDLISHYMTEDLHKIMKENSADRTDKLVNQLEVIDESYLNPLLSMITSVFTFLFSLIGAFYLQGMLTVIMLALCFLPFLAPAINQKILANKKLNAQNKKKAYLSAFENVSKNIPFIRLSGAQQIFAKDLSEKSYESAHNTIEFRKSQSATYAVSYGLSNIVYTGTWIIGGIFVYNRLLSIPSLIAMTTLMSTVSGPIQNISEYAADFASSKKVVHSLICYLSGNEQKKTESQPALTEKIDHVKLTHISYRINQKPLFENISIDFQNGKKYAIVGDSGVGKTTLLQMIMGILPYHDGQITLNDMNLTQIDPVSYYKHFTYVPQRTALFYGSIAENISMFHEPDEEKVILSLQRAGLQDWLSKQENGINTILTNENSLSGGEERRFDIARALYRETEMIILDEPTSGLDAENELLIASLLGSLTDKIMIVVTHSTSPQFMSVFDHIIRLERPLGCEQSISEDH